VPKEAEFQVIPLLAALTNGGVDYVVIGAVAARMLGSAVVTRDLDVCYARDETNLEALAAALRGLHARLRGVEGEVPFKLDARTLRAGDSFTFTTTRGDLDVLGTPAGTTGYDDLVRGAVRVDVDGMVVMAASVPDLMRMKRAAGRPKDLLQLELLAALLEELEAPNEDRARSPAASGAKASLYSAADGPRVRRPPP
jgi:hypothetical protein